MKFTELSKKDFGLAVVVFQKKLPQDFFERLTFEQWLRVYDKALSGSKLEKTALRKVSESAKTFEQWLRVYDKAPPVSKLKKTALEKMSELAETFDQRLRVYDRAPPGSKLEKTALEKMLELVNKE